MKIAVDDLKKFCKEILERNSVPIEEAEVIADSLVDANTIGVDSHGVTRLSLYLQRLKEATINSNTKMEILRETETTALYDANNGWGQYAGKIAMQEAVKKAKKYGTATIGVTNSNHFGTASYFTKMAAKENCIGIAMCNTTPIMVSWGSNEPTLGTNPLSIAIPTNRHPVVLDMATSNVARGKINLAAKDGEEIPTGWAITKEGKDTTDPHEALKGYLLPLGPKGSGLAMMIDIMSGVMTGALFGKDIPRMYDDKEPQRLGHLFMAIDPECFIEIETFKSRMDERIEQTVKSTPADGYEQVYMPGDIEEMNREKHEREGLTLSTALYEELRALGTKYDVSI
ncbi:Ldh family oxidoreductase [Oceanobacillus luteolus]|uniref:Ldh family oxidoreductase n=1 Tax=Oceanobacillus luteolus TaxID=1274358 RepID=UPI00203D6336|nr:Ldh family oxidoreductase [Oceanobacillus luteolus]MCM3740928.1 Ldh family oxidoreductase [Oceanobacillus luteolus]